MTSRAPNGRFQDPGYCCQPGFTGSYCAVCDQGFYSPTVNTCRLCDLSFGVFFAFILGLASAFVLLVFVLFAPARLRYQVLLFIQFVQTMAVMLDFNVAFPRFYVLSFAWTFAMAGSPGNQVLSCVVRFNLLADLFIVLMTTVALLLFNWVISEYLRGQKRSTFGGVTSYFWEEELSIKTWGRMGLILQIMSIPMMRSLTKTLDALLGRWYLFFFEKGISPRDAYDVTMNEARFQSAFFLIIAIAFLAWSVVTFTWLPYKHVKSPPEKGYTYLKYHALYQQWRKTHWYFNVITLAKDLALCIGVYSLDRLPGAQIPVVCGVILFYGVFVATSRPFYARVNFVMFILTTSANALAAVFSFIASPALNLGPKTVTAVQALNLIVVWANVAAILGLFLIQLPSVRRKSWLMAKSFYRLVGKKGSRGIFSPIPDTLPFDELTMDESFFYGFQVIAGGELRLSKGQTVIQVPNAILTGFDMASVYVHVSTIHDGKAPVIMAAQAIDADQDTVSFLVQPASGTWRERNKDFQSIRWFLFAARTRMDYPPRHVFKIPPLMTVTDEPAPAPAQNAQATAAGAAQPYRPAAPKSKAPPRKVKRRRRSRPGPDDDTYYSDSDTYERARTSRTRHKRRSSGFFSWFSGGESYETSYSS